MMHEERFLFRLVLLHTTGVLAAVMLLLLLMLLTDTATDLMAS